MIIIIFVSVNKMYWQCLFWIFFTKFPTFPFLMSEYSLTLSSGLNAPNAECDPGFFCPGGDSVSNPPATPCPIGLHCPQGSPQPVPCEPGTYTNLTQQAECLVCPAGFYCVPEEVVEGE